MNDQPAQRLFSNNTVEAEAIAELKSQLSISEVSGMIFFCSSLYNLGKLSEALNSSFDFPIIGCTTAGEICDQHFIHSIVALVFSSADFELQTVSLNELESFDSTQYLDSLSELEARSNKITSVDNNKRFGFLLVDGLSKREEELTSLLQLQLGDIELFGGSAGDDFNFENTHIFENGSFKTNLAVLALISTQHEFELFRHQHFVPTEKELVITEVDVRNRLVKEIDGEPAAKAYAEINGLDPENLTDDDFAMNPLMLKVGDGWYIRAIGNAYPDGSLGFYCSIDEGLPLSIAKGEDMVGNLKKKVDSLLDSYDEVYFTLGCDCAFRRLEMEKNLLSTDIKEQLSRLNFIGFNSYGEQYSGLHLNQTLIGVVVGRKKDV